jgi:hypothetical protein
MDNGGSKNDLSGSIVENQQIRCLGRQSNEPVFTRQRDQCFLELLRRESWGAGGGNAIDDVEQPRRREEPRNPCGERGVHKSVDGCEACRGALGGKGWWEEVWTEERFKCGGGIDGEEVCEETGCVWGSHGRARDGVHCSGTSGPS